MGESPDTRPTRVVPREGAALALYSRLYLRRQPAELLRVGRAQLLARAAVRRGLAELTLAHRRGALALRGGRTSAAEMLLCRHQHVEGLGGLAGRRGRAGVRRAVGGQPRVRWARGRGGLLRGAGEARPFGGGGGRRRPIGES